MKRFFAVLLVVVMLLSMAACSNNAQLTPETTPVTTEEPEVFRTVDLIKEGAVCSIVHDGTMGASQLANELKMTFSANFGVTVEVTSDTEAATGCEIIIGEARPVAEKTIKKLRVDMDFAIKVEENALVLCATDQLSYDYLGQYLKSTLFAKNETGTLTVDSDDNLIYASSDLTDQNYIEYMQAGNAYVSWDSLFAYKEYMNADTVLPYRIYVPFNYTPDKKVPILVNLHGAGLRGDDNQKQLKFIDKMLMQTDMPVDDAIIIFPQCPEGQKWVDSNWSVGSYSLKSTPESNELRAVVELVQQLMQTYPVDEQRIYACGFSMGGYGTWNLLMNHPDLFCAGIPMCGAGDPSMAEVLKDIPIWAVHGAKDPTVPVQGSRDMANAIETIGGEKLQYTELPDNEHDVWNYTYSNPEMFKWLFEQKKGQ